MTVNSPNITDNTGGTSDVSLSGSSNGTISATGSKLKINDSHNFTLAGADHPLVALTNSSNIKVDGTAWNICLDSATNTNIKGGLIATKDRDACVPPSVQVTSSSNGTISATNSALNILKSFNFKVFVETHRQVFLKSCSNILINGTHGDVHLDSATNTKIHGDNNTVKAEGVSNFTVQGNGNTVHVKDVFNHTVQPSPVGETNIFRVSSTSGNQSILARFAAYALGSSRFVQCDQQTFNVDYVGKAKICGTQYDLGQFRFHAKKYASHVDVRVETESPFEVSLSDQGTQVELRRQTKASGAQKLVLRGSKITQTDNNEFRIIPLSNFPRTSNL